MINQIIKAIKEYDTIIIHRHSRPDGDALGSQVGLKEALKTTFPNKRVLITGDMTARYAFIGEMDEVEDKDYQGALVIVVDTAAPTLISDERYLMGHYIIKIDHHTSGADYGNINYVDTEQISCASLLAKMIFENNLQLNANGAKALFTGLITDSGRFRYMGVTAETFELAAKLMQYDFLPEDIYGQLYSEDLEMVRLRAQFTLRMQLTPSNVAYIKTTQAMLQEYNTDIFSVSRGMVSIMSGIKGISIWVNFTETEEGQVIAELRSNKYNINPIAVKYNGGGHRFASGATLANFSEADNMLADLDLLMKEENNE